MHLNKSVRKSTGILCLISHLPISVIIRVENKVSLQTMRDTKNLVGLFLEQKPRLYKKGQIIIRPDDTLTSVFYIEKGFVKGYSLTEHGEQKNHIIYKSGDIFPLVSAINPTGRISFIETVEKTQLRKIDYEKFINLIKSDNSLLFEVTQKIIGLMREYIDRIDGLEYTKANQRIIDHLLYLASYFGKRKGKKILIEVPITHKDIAESTAISRETVSRELETLKRKKLIQKSSKFTIINNIKKLEKELYLQFESKKL